VRITASAGQEKREKGQLPKKKKTGSTAGKKKDGGERQHNDSLDAAQNIGRKAASVKIED